MRTGDCRSWEEAEVNAGREMEELIQRQGQGGDRAEGGRGEEEGKGGKEEGNQDEGTTILDNR